LVVPSSRPMARKAFSASASTASRDAMLARAGAALLLCHLRAPRARRARPRSRSFTRETLLLPATAAARARREGWWVWCSRPSGPPHEAAAAGFGFADQHMRRGIKTKQIFKLRSLLSLRCPRPAAAPWQPAPRRRSQSAPPAYPRCRLLENAAPGALFA
jgi:hypothetical protein